MSKDFERWCQVENAECKIEQIITLLNLFCNEYVDISPNSFRMMAAVSQEGMSNILSLAMTTLGDCKTMLTDAIDGKGDAA